MTEVEKIMSLSTMKKVLESHSEREKPLLKSKIKSQITVCKCPQEQRPDFWRNLLWSDETKIEVFVHNDCSCVCGRGRSFPAG